MTVKGDKFYSGLTSVKLDNQTVPAVSIQSEAELSFKLPAGNAGLVDLEILNHIGVSSQLSQAFKYDAPLVETVRVTLARDSLVANGQATTPVLLKFNSNASIQAPPRSFGLGAEPTRSRFPDAPSLSPSITVDDLPMRWMR